MNPPQRPARHSNAAFPQAVIEMAGRQLLEIGWIPARYEEALREAMRRADEAEAADLDFYQRGKR